MSHTIEIRGFNLDGLSLAAIVGLMVLGTVMVSSASISLADQAVGEPGRAVSRDQYEQNQPPGAGDNGETDEEKAREGAGIVKRAGLRPRMFAQIVGPEVGIGRKPFAHGMNSGT